MAKFRRQVGPLGSSELIYEVMVDLLEPGSCIAGSEIELLYPEHQAEEIVAVGMPSSGGLPADRRPADVAPE